MDNFVDVFQPCFFGVFDHFLDLLSSPGVALAIGVGRPEPLDSEWLDIATELLRNC